MDYQKHKACLVCNSSQLKPMNGYERHFLTKCGDCGFVFIERIPTLDELNQHYFAYSYGKEQHLPQATIDSFEKLLDTFEPYRKTNRMLDVGCGQGWLLERAKMRGWDVFGTEYSETAVSICTNRGIKMYQGVLNPLTMQENDFDVIISSEVLEHINNPQEELKNIYQLLRKEGLFYFTTPNFDCILRYMLKADYNIIVYPEHLSYYTKSTMNKMLTSVGFKKKRILTSGISFTRFINSKSSKESGKAKEEAFTPQASDEKLREAIRNKPYLEVLKSMANWALDVTSTGITLKGYYEK